jgi:hypothetical protein
MASTGRSSTPALSHWKRGACANGLVGRMEAIDAEVLATLRDDIFRPTVVEQAIALALEALKPARQNRARAALERELRNVREDAERLADAVERGDRNVDAAREVLRMLLVDSLRFTPLVEGARRAYAFEGAIALERLVSDVIELPTLTGVASPTGLGKADAVGGLIRRAA